MEIYRGYEIHNDLDFDGVEDWWIIGPKGQEADVTSRSDAIAFIDHVLNEVSYYQTMGE